MSVVIVGGNECMQRRYKDLCHRYRCEAKVYTKTLAGLKTIGRPDLMVIFTGTVSHTMVRSALREVRGGATRVARCHSSSLSALREVLCEHLGEEAACHE